MQIPRLVADAARSFDVGRHLNRRAVRNAATAVASDQARAHARDDVRRAVARANLSAQLMRHAAS
jgi:hypothetical protein